MEIFLIVLISVIFFITLTLFVTITLEYDLLKNEGKIKIILFKFVPIFISTIIFNGEYLSLKNAKNKVTNIKIDFNDKRVIYFNYVSKNLLKKINVTTINFFSILCLTNPSVSALINSVINVGISVLYSYILSLNTDIKLTKTVLTGFRQDLFKINISFSFLFSLYDVFWSLLMAYKQLKRREYEKASKLQQNR